MSAFITSAWGVISASAQLVIGTRQMTERASRFLNVENEHLRKSERSKLSSLQMRLECLVQPLNTLLLYTIDKDSTLQPVVVNALHVCQSACQFISKIEKFNPDDGEMLNFHLHELSFACESVSMALSMVNVMQSKQQGIVVSSSGNQISSPGLNDVNVVGTGSTNVGTGNVGTGSTNVGTGYSIKGEGTSGNGSTMHPRISPSALLKASRRIQELYGAVGGDLCVCLGTLCSKPLDSLHWKQVYTARLKIVVQQKSYCLRLDPVVLDNFDGVNPPTSSIEFPIGLAVEFDFTSAREVPGVSDLLATYNQGGQKGLSSPRSPRVLGTTTPGTIPTSCSQRGDSIYALDNFQSRLSGQAAIRFIECGVATFVDNDLEDEAFHVISADIKRVDNARREYCFVFDQFSSGGGGVRGTIGGGGSTNYNNPSSGQNLNQINVVGGVNGMSNINHFTPIEFFYTARLCAVDDRSGLTGRSNSNSDFLSQQSPFQLFATDESLQEILAPKRKGFSDRMEYNHHTVTPKTSSAVKATSLNPVLVATVDDTVDDTTTSSKNDSKNKKLGDMQIETETLRNPNEKETCVEVPRSSKLS